MAQRWGRHGYQLVEKAASEQPERVRARNVLIGMKIRGYGSALKMRALAAQLRAHAAETAVEHFRHKFEIAASELEEQAVDAESRARFRDGHKLVS